MLGTEEQISRLYKIKINKFYLKQFSTKETSNRKQT
jgi:hypothetical protein